MRDSRTSASTRSRALDGLDITPSTGADPPCVSCVGGKLARHTFPAKGSDAEEALAVVHIDLCGPFRVVAEDGSLYLLLLKDCHTRFVWVIPVAKKSDVLREFQKWLVLVERQAKKTVLMLRSDRGGEFLGKEFTEFVDGKGIIHDLTCPYTPLQNGMAEREMRMAVESFMVPEQQRGGKLAPKACWGLHLGVSPESKGWEVLNLTNNKVVTSVEVIFYVTLSQEVWKAKFGPASRRTQPHPPMDTLRATLPLLAEVDKPTDEDVVEVLPPPPVLAPPFPVADRYASTPVSATGNEGSLEESHVAQANGIAGGRQGAKLVDQDGKPSTTGEQLTGEPVEQEAAVGVQSTGELSKSAESSQQLVDELAFNEEGELSAGEESTDNDVVEVPITKPELRRIGRARRPPERLSFHACLAPAAFTTAYDDAEEDEERPDLDPDVHADPEHRWDITTMTVKEAMASWKGEAVCGANYNEMYSPMSSYVMLRIFLSIVAALDLNLMQLDMKNDFLQSKLDRVLYMYQPDYFDDGTSRVCKLLKSLYGLKQSPLLWYRALDGVLLGAGWKKSQVDKVLYFKAGDNGVTCWVLVYVDDLLAASSNPAMLKELKELLEAAFELRKILPIVKYLGLEVVRDRPTRNLWLHQQGYADKLRRRFIDEEQGGRVPKTPVSIDAYAELTFDDDEAQEHKEEEYRQKVGSLQFAASESKYIAAMNACKEGRRLRFLAEFNQLDAGKPTILSVDKSAITAAEGLGLTGNLKHMERRYAWLQHMVRRRKFELKYIPTTEQPADFLTKALHFPTFNRCAITIGQVRLADVGDNDDDVQQ
ncbi:unnamed protein product [Closterium sp. NIES-54]